MSQPKITLFLCEDNKEEPRRIAVGGILEQMNIQTDEPIMVENTICEDSHDRNIVCNVSKEDKSERTKKKASIQDQDSDKDSLSTMITTPSVGTVAKQIVESQSLTGEGGYELNDRVDMNLCHGMEVNGKAMQPMPSMNMNESMHENKLGLSDECMFERGICKLHRVRGIKVGTPMYKKQADPIFFPSGSILPFFFSI